MKEIKVTDSISPTDSGKAAVSRPTGIIKIYDIKTKKLLVSGHNMVVDDGISYLYYEFIKNGFSTFIPGVAYSSLSSPVFSGISLGYDGSPAMTTKSMKYEDISSTLTDTLSFSSTVTSGLELSVNPSNFEITFSISLNGSGTLKKFNEVVISYKDSGTDYLFSRAIIDPISLDDDSKVKFVYNIIL